jgi:excinuclease ABC subunit A
MFSFNNPQGACPECSGLGTKRYFDAELIVPNPDLSLREGAIAPWATRQSIYYQQMLDAICQHYHVDVYTPYKNLPKKVQEVFLSGSGEESIKFYFERDDHRHYYKRPFEGVIPSLERRYRETESYMIREEIEKFLSLQACPACKGARLKPVPLAVTLHRLPIHELTALSIEKTYDFFQDLQLDPKERAIAERLLKEIRERLWFLRSGPDHLSLDRPVLHPVRR